MKSQKYIFLNRETLKKHTINYYVPLDNSAKQIRIVEWIVSTKNIIFF